MYIAGRERKVIEFLLQAQEDVTVKEIANVLEVSERTIHRDLKSIEKVMVHHNLELTKKSGVGLRIIGDKNDKEQLELTLANGTLSDFIPEERRTIILASLLGAKEPIKLFTLAAELNVTIATVSHDLDQLEGELANLHLSLLRKRGYGVKVEGDEANKRAAISKLITTHVDPFEFVSLVKENIQKKSNQQLKTISDRLLGLVNPNMLSAIETRVEQARDELPHELADSAYIGLVVHLALAMERLQKGEKIKFDQAFLKQIEGTKEYDIAKKMIEDLAVSLTIDIPDDEIGYITMHLMGAKLRVDQHYLVEDASLDIAFQIKELIKYVGSQLEVDLTENTSLLNDLIAHLKPTIYRLKQGMNINNPLIEDITRDYLDLFHLIQSGVDDIFPDMTFPDDEIGYLVLHFAAALMHDEEELELSALVICSSGIGTAKILATKLKQQIQEIKQVENISLFDLKRINSAPYDIIVSTIPLKGFAGDYILTSPILTQAEVHRIKKKVRQKKLAYKAKNNQVGSKPKREDTGFIPQLEAMQNYSKVILELLASFHVKQITEKRSMEAILHLIGNELAGNQIIQDKENVIKKLLEREKVGGLGIPTTSLALFHTRSKDVIRLSFTIYSLSHPIKVQGMDGEKIKMDTLLLMLAPEVTHKEVLEVLSYVSSLTIQGEASVNLFTSGNEAQIKQFLSQQFHTFLHEKNLL